MAELDAPQHGNIVYGNCYKIHLQEVFAHFPKNRVRILIFEQWTKSPKATCADLFNFLGVTPFGDVALPDNLNERTRYGPESLEGVFNERLSEKVQDAVLARLEPDIAYVEALVGHRLPEWRQRRPSDQ